METILIDIIAGARPNFMKIAPIIHCMEQRQQNGGPLRFRLIHTGQHYDRNMSGNFFEQLGIPDPDVNLEIGSGSQAEQTAGIMIGYEKLLHDTPSRLCLVVGDVTSTMACAIAAQKTGVPVAHVEAGIRSGDWSMPEEINRMVTDAVSNWFFTTTEMASDNLRRQGIADDRIFFVGNTMIDTLLAQQPHFQAPEVFAQEGLSEGEYLVLTLHRPANVDDECQLRRLLQAIADSANGLPVVFPVHPRTAQSLARLGTLPGHFVQIPPQPYLEFNYLVSHARAVITDSGGVTEETTVLGIPCMTLRDTTERPETVTVGTNELLGTDPNALPPAMARLFAGKWKKGKVPEKWDGHTGDRIVAVLEQLLTS